jgi:hypothetical protein
MAWGGPWGTPRPKSTHKPDPNWDFLFQVVVSRSDLGCGGTMAAFPQ